MTSIEKYKSYLGCRIKISTKYHWSIIPQLRYSVSSIKKCPDLQERKSGSKKEM